LLIESTGIAEPLPVAETFTFRDEDGTSLSDIARLDTMVTVVDAYNFLRDYSSQDFLSDRGESLGEDDQRTVVSLLIEQVEFCDVIVLNKTDLLSAADVTRLEAILRALNPRADILHASFGKVKLEQILNTGRFDFEQAPKHRAGCRNCAANISPKPKNMAFPALFIRRGGPFILPAFISGSSRAGLG
jgi:G3E family GTPase